MDCVFPLTEALHGAYSLLFFRTVNSIVPSIQSLLGTHFLNSKDSSVYQGKARPSLTHSANCADTATWAQKPLAKFSACGVARLSSSAQRVICQHNPSFRSSSRNKTISSKHCHLYTQSCFRLYSSEIALPVLLMAPVVPPSHGFARLGRRALVTTVPALASHHFERRGLTVNHTQGVTLGVICAYVVVIALLWNLPYVRWVLWPFKV